ncbi:hypothetical protein M9Y10_044313 [Tritrichomonas musculus]|uniref:Uncharacterized protein n=1 Tax=Tritrichomonas musculus TaxID=1915356 RepID=A0ABR2K268_9EUKA
MKNKLQSQRERLESVLSIPPAHFANRMINHLSNKITYLSKLNFVSTPVHIELLYIAKKRPDTFLTNDILKFLTNIVDDRSKELPKALATTLFMIFGQVYRNHLKPPLIMAKLLFRDVIGPQEFCHFERAAEFIQRVQLTYFFQPSLLSPETRLALYRQSKPAAEEVPESYFQWDSELSVNLAHLQKNVDSEIKVIRKHPTDSRLFPRYANVLIFFMTMPEGQETFINEFDYICATFPSYIPQMFLAVQFFLLNANARDNLAADFAKQFAQLNSKICHDEYQNTLSMIIAANQLYFPVISGANLTLDIKKDNQNIQSISLSNSETINPNLLSSQMSGSITSFPIKSDPTTQIYSSNRNDQDIVQYLFQAIYMAPDDKYFENIRKLNDQYSQTKPPLTYTCEVLSKFLDKIPTEDIKIDSVNRIISAFDIFLKNTNFTNSQQQKKHQQPQSQVNGVDYIEISELISLFVTKLSQTQFLMNVSQNLPNIIVPIPLKNDGLPFKQESLIPFIQNSDLHFVAYHMIYSAAKYLVKCNSRFPAVLGQSNPIIDKSIVAFCKSQYWNVGAKSFALGCLLILISPDDIGAKLYLKEEKLQKMFRSFLRKFLGRPNELDSLPEDIKFQDQIANNEEMKNFISSISHLKYLPSTPVLCCRSPVNYLDDLLTKEEKLTSIPKYITPRITKEMIETVSYVGLTKYIFASIYSFAKSRANITVSEIYRQEKVYQWVVLLLQKSTSQERTKMLMFYANYLEKKERPLRISAYVMILLLNADIINEQNNSYDSSEITSRENSSISIQSASKTLTTTTIRVPIRSFSNMNGYSGSYIALNFDLPDNEQMVKIISKSLYIDNEVEIAKTFVFCLSHSQYVGNALAEFVEKRPLLANCLQEPSLSKLLKSKVSYDLPYAPNFNYPNFNECLSLSAPKSQRFEYHSVPSKRPKLTDLSQLPTEDTLAVYDSKYIQDDQNEFNNNSEFLNKFECPSDKTDVKLNPFESSQLELEVYRFEMILYGSNSTPPDPNSEDYVKTFFFEDFVQWFALASLKRYVLGNNEAFLLYARPTLNVLYTEIGHANFLTKIMMNRLISLLSITYIKLIHHKNNLSQKERNFIHNELLPKIEMISNFDQIKQYGIDLPTMVPALLSTILNNFDNQFTSSTKQKLAHGNLNVISATIPNSYFSKKSLNVNNSNNNISAFVLPCGVPFEMMIDSNDMINRMQQSLIITTDDYASKWLLNAAVQCPQSILQNKNFMKNMLIPLILSAKKDAVIQFFRLMREQIPDDTKKLMDNVAAIVNSVFGHKKQGQ